jgi:hypothetical protein
MKRLLFKQSGWLWGWFFFNSTVFFWGPTRPTTHDIKVIFVRSCSFFHSSFYNKTNSKRRMTSQKFRSCDVPKTFFCRKTFVLTFSCFPKNNNNANSELDILMFPKQNKVNWKFFQKTTLLMIVNWINSSFKKASEQSLACREGPDFQKNLNKLFKVRS